MTIVGAGAGVAELTALAVVSELAPTRKRGTYIAVLIFSIVPFVPSSFYAQLIACEYSVLYQQANSLTQIRSFDMATCRHHRLRLERHRVLFDFLLLSSASSNQLHGQVKERGSTRDRLHRRVSQHIWNGALHGWNAMGRISGKPDVCMHYEHR